MRTINTPLSRVERGGGSCIKIVPVEHPQMSEKLFVKAKQFAEMTGAPYIKVLDWISVGMPVLPDSANPYWIIVPAAVEWLRKRFLF